MHIWGDDWEHWDMLYKAIDEISNELRKVHIGFYSKEKYGTARFDFFHYWDGTIHGWFRPSYCCVHKPWRYFWSFDLKLSKFFRLIGLVGIVQKWQNKKHIRIFTDACKKYPYLIKELLFDCNLNDETIKELKKCTKNLK